MEQAIDIEELKKIKKRRKRRRGIVLIAIGFFALVTPFTPGSWLIFVGLEMLGVHWVLLDKLTARIEKRREERRREKETGVSSYDT